MKPLTALQAQVLRNWKGTTCSGYECKCHTNTLFALQERGLIKCRGVHPAFIKEHGYNFYEWTLTGKRSFSLNQIQSGNMLHWICYILLPTG